MYLFCLFFLIVIYAFTVCILFYCVYIYMSVIECYQCFGNVKPFIMWVTLPESESVWFDRETLLWSPEVQWEPHMKSWIRQTYIHNMSQQCYFKPICVPLVLGHSVSFSTQYPTFISPESSLQKMCLLLKQLYFSSCVSER